MVLTAINAINYLNYLFQTLQFYRTRFQYHDVRRRNSIGIILNLIQLMYNFTKWIFRRWATRRRNANKPHVLIKLLNQYRCTRFNGNFWNNLERNWCDFFWLTGETPETLTHLVTSLQQYKQRIAPRTSRKGRRKKLDFRNEVKNILGG